MTRATEFEKGSVWIAEDWWSSARTRPGAVIASTHYGALSSRYAVDISGFCAEDEYVRAL